MNIQIRPWGLSVESMIVSDRYIVTRQGDVYRIGKYTNHRQKPRNHSNGYLRCTISGKDFYIHRLVAMCFIENPNGCLEVNHIDGDKKNNREENLEWCTRAQNNKHAFQTKLRKYSELSEIAKRPRIRSRKFTASDLRIIEKMIRDAKSDRHIAKSVNGSRGAVYQIRAGKTYKEAVSL